MKVFTHTNDLNGQRCYIEKEVLRQELIDVGVTPSSNELIVVNEDGSKSHLFPWEVTELREQK